MTFQELIWKVQPDLIIETGIAHGGSLIFSASMLALLETFGLVKAPIVVGLDIEIRKHNRDIIENDPGVMNTSFTEGPEVFNLIIKVNDQIISHRIFDGKLYPPKVRYTVDVRLFLKEMLRDLTEIFSSKDLTYKYLGLDLVK
jgi:hypothetical protein